MKQKTIIWTFVLMMLVGGLTACGLFGGEEPTPESIPVTVSQPNVVSAEAFVVPLQEADLAFEIGGRLLSLEIQEGDPVSKGQFLAQLDNTIQLAQLSEAEANLANAQAGLANAEANLAQAEARLANTKAGATEEEIAEAQANVARAEAALADVMAGATPEEIAEAEAGSQTARARLAQVLAGSRDEDIQAASSRLLQAEADVRLAQADYDENIFGEPDRAEPFGVALQQATLEFEGAQAEYDKLLNGATDEEIAISRAELNEAEVALRRVLAGATTEEIAQAQAEVAAAAAALARLEAGARAEEIAIDEAAMEVAQAGVAAAQTDIQMAEAGVELAQAEVAKTQLVAPFDGVISQITVDEGEIVQAGTTMMALGDTSRWQIETDDLTEIDIVQVQVGATVQISVDALPNETFEGEVVRITPKSETKAGDVTYTVLIEITQGDTSPLRWGMTTFVDIEVAPDL